VTADHGESLGDHGLVDHVFSLYEETTRVPLIARFPPVFAEGRRDDPVQLHDLAPTLLALAGLPPVEGMQGLDLSCGPVDSDRPVLLAYGFPVQALSALQKHHGTPEAIVRYGRRLWALRAGDWKLILGSDGQRELYDLARDPDERCDLSGTSAGTARADALETELQRILERITRGKERGPDVSSMDEVTRLEMRKLGYD
jgi:arylsulfatase A-like enzyme